MRQVAFDRKGSKMRRMNMAHLTDIERATFQRRGYIVCKRLAPDSLRQLLTDISKLHATEAIAPIEFEIDVHYPGSPTDPDSPGAGTPRRLLQAYARDAAFRQWATSEEISAVLGDLFTAVGKTMLSQCHHNCVMTKSPGYSSATLWHQDIRYWSFDREELISAWLALGAENRRNGCLRVIPGSHLLDLDRGRFDATMFLRPDLPENKALLAQAETVELEAGDVLFFHCRLFHAAGRNLTDETKLSAVFTYHQADNRPIDGTRSARFPSIAVGGR